MKRLLVIMLILVAVGVVSAATITIHADTGITVSYQTQDDQKPIEINGNVIRRTCAKPTFFNIEIEWFDVGAPYPHWYKIENAYVPIWNNSDDIHLYYQFVTGNNDPTNPNQ